MDTDDVRAGRAFGVDFTNHGWRRELGIMDAPEHDPREAGRRLAEVARGYAFAFFEHWLTDYAGHRGSLADGVRLLETFDRVLAGVLEAWDPADGLVAVTSDHGNLEDLRHRHHTRNPVPTLIVGQERAAFADGLRDLTGFAPAILRALAA
jgi:2,3-bisphosphoglycerate-independent phosphoglycerate mutase